MSQRGVLETAEMLQILLIDFARRTAAAWRADPTVLACCDRPVCLPIVPACLPACSLLCSIFAIVPEQNAKLTHADGFIKNATLFNISEVLSPHSRACQHRNQSPDI